MTSAKMGFLTLILAFVVLGLFPVQFSHAESIPVRQIQRVQENAPFVYQGLDNPNDYNWQGDWDPRKDRDWDRRINHDRDIGNSSGAAAPCGS